MIRNFFLFLLIPVLLYSSQEDTVNLALQNKLVEKNEWKALLHYDKNFKVTDKKFLISKKHSLKNELVSTIKAFYDLPDNYKNINNHPQCKFPARFLFITHELNISKNEFPKVNCQDLQTYKQKAPADKIYLTYASENVKNPSSMMGHTFLKYSGKNYKNREVEHAVTFYTVLDSLNLAKLAYQNIFSGMKGLFALQPYNKIVKQYTDKENRNVWEYQLSLSQYRRKLIYYHIWELKDIDMKYFFTSYNCSTVIYYILSLANPKIYDERKLWITPLDTVKFLYKYKLIKNSQLFPSDEWLVKMLAEHLNTKEISKVKQIIEEKKYDKISNLNFYLLKFLKAYSSVEHKKRQISDKEFLLIKKKVKKSLQNSNKHFDISKYKSPNKIPNEKQFGIGYSNINKNNYMKISFLPASHLLNDDNREYFGESELKIAYLSVLLNKESIKLDEFTLYGMQSYIAYDSLTNDLSYQFELAIKKEYTKDISYIKTFKIGGGIGVDFLLAKDINIFSTLSAGVGYNKDDNAHIYLNPKIGAMLYEVFNMKSLLYYQPLFINANKVYDKFVLNHNIFFSKNYKFYFNLEKISSDKSYTNYEVGLKVLF